MNTLLNDRTQIQRHQKAAFLLSVDEFTLTLLRTADSRVTTVYPVKVNFKFYLSTPPFPVYCAIS